MVVIGLIFAGLAALLHVYIFYLESFAWTGEKGRATFGLSPDEAEATKSLAFNQGFYNLFLAASVVIGIVAFSADSRVVGATLVFTGVASMTAAAIVLLASSPDKRSAALKQGALPLLALLCLILGFAL